MDEASLDDSSPEGTMLRFQNSEGISEPPDSPGIGTLATLPATQFTRGDVRSAKLTTSRKDSCCSISCMPSFNLKNSWMAVHSFPRDVSTAGFTHCWISFSKFARRVVNWPIDTSSRTTAPSEQKRNSNSWVMSYQNHNTRTTTTCSSLETLLLQEIQ